VVLAEHDFGGHVAGCAAGVVEVLVAVLAGDAEVGESEVSGGVEHEVLGFEVAVDYVFGVQVLEGEEHAADEEFCLGLGEAAAFADVVAQVAAVEVVHYEVQVLAVLEGVGHVH
jgi:hypothetical protein